MSPAVVCCSVRQARVASKGATVVLLKRLIRHFTRDTEDDLLCMEMLCNALASLMLYKSNQEQLFGTYKSLTSPPPSDYYYANYYIVSIIIP